MSIEQLAGWFPAIIFPLASLAQLLAIVRTGQASGVSILSWSLFALANVALYVYVGRYTEPQAILSFLLTATVNVLIVIATLRRRSVETRKC